MPLDVTVGVIGLGYVGLPLIAACASAGYECIGYDLDGNKIDKLNQNQDPIGDLSLDDLQELKCVTFTDSITCLRDCNIFIICVPTPVDAHNVPDLSLLRLASEQVSEVISSGNYIVYESTVYPGVTRDVCIPIIEENTKLKLNHDFFVGYSPERVNPGDKDRSIKNIKKVVSGSNSTTAQYLSSFYNSFIDAGTFVAESLEIAEAAKVIENIQRDVNIALINELEMLLDKIDIPIYKVLEAANTKWNFLNFKPGLVGGHCIGVDPYYLTHLAAKYNFHPRLITSGRLTNDNMSKFYADKILKTLFNLKSLRTLNILVLGLTFKENVADLRNSKVFDLIDQLIQFGLPVSIYDPLVKRERLEEKYQDIFDDRYKLHDYSVVILAVPHDAILTETKYFSEELKNNEPFIFDLKNVLGRDV